MAGMGYVLSYDLVKWISQDPFPKMNQIGQEDGMLAFWLVQSQLVQHWLSDTDKSFYDFPDSGKGWAHPYSRNTILIHQLKQDDCYLKVVEHFLGRVQRGLQALPRFLQPLHSQSFE
jgi:galactosylxylosylprotein 3-beta-galactosyltransferase